MPFSRWIWPACVSIRNVVSLPQFLGHHPHGKISNQYSSGAFISYGTACEPVHTNAKERSDPATAQKIKHGPGLDYFLHNTHILNQVKTEVSPTRVPYLNVESYAGNCRKVFFDVYGCQMNVNDTEIAWSVLKTCGYKRVEDVRNADVVLVVTCSIREGAEQKVWNKLENLKGLKKKRALNRHQGPPLKIGILGCMAERLKHRWLEREAAVDLVAGPDSYRDLPRLLSQTDNKSAVNVQLSFEETYADIAPVRLDSSSIMRGCDNMCTYCIVPFVRGRERSRPVKSIVEEVRRLSGEGVKEVVLLGQNVNSYRDTSETLHLHSSSGSTETNLSLPAFKTVYKPKRGGLRFASLLDSVSSVDPEMRIRFTSPHPKDFPPEVLSLIAERPNVCKSLHLPAQSGNNEILQSMRRGYTREAYLELVQRVKETVPNVALSSDFICGFCGETEDQFEDTLSLIREVGYNNAFLFPYSIREKTYAYHKLNDNVPVDVKKQRLLEMVEVFREEATKINQVLIGTHQLVLVEGDSKRSSHDLQGRSDSNVKVIFPKVEISTGKINPGSYILVNITDANSQVLKGHAVQHMTLQEFSKNHSCT